MKAHLHLTISRTSRIQGITIRESRSYRIPGIRIVQFGALVSLVAILAIV